MTASVPAPVARVSIILEMENAQTVEWREVGRTIEALTIQIESLPPHLRRAAQVIVAHPGAAETTADLLGALRREAPLLAEVAEIRGVSVPRGRYYELKNAGLKIATGDLIVLLDSDAVPEPGWLEALLTPFADPGVVAVAGHTYLGHSGLISRTLALVWVFPLRDRDGRAASRRPLHANNCAFRAAWIKAHSFPIDNGFKVGCTRLMRVLASSGVELVRVPAYVQHAPLEGWRFLLWRALVTGRDADRKIAGMHGASRLRRLSAALKTGLKTTARAVRRVLVHHRNVALPLWQVPLAVLLGVSFYTLACAGQVSRALGMGHDQPEHIPAFVEHH